MNSTQPLNTNANTGARQSAHTTSARLHHARLIMREGNRYCAQTDEGAIWVQAAAGCLLTPEVGDVALISLTGHVGYILNVLERAHKTQPAVLAVPGELQVRASQLTLQASTAQMNFEQLQMQGKQLKSEWHRRIDVANQQFVAVSYCESMFNRRVTQVQGHDDMRSESYRQTVNQDWTVRANTNVVLGQSRVVVNGNAVQIG